MDPIEVVSRLAGFSERGPGTDAERRAAVELRKRLSEAGRAARIETVWVRPHWATAHAIHAALAVAGSVVAASEPAIGLGILLLTLASLLADLSGRPSLGRLLTQRRATQNVVTGTDAPPPVGRVRLIIAASLDAGRGGAVYRDPWVRLEAALRRRTGGHWPSALALLALAIAALAGVAGARLAGAGGLLVGALQLLPTVFVLVAFAALIDIALSTHSPGANADASAVAVALALEEELARRPPRRIDVALVLAGAGSGGALGMREFVAARRNWPAERMAVLALEPCGSGTPVWWTHDGPLAAVRLHPRLVALARAGAASERRLHARPYRGHGNSAALPARRARWPAIAIGALDEHDRPGVARRPADRVELVSRESLQATLELCLELIARLDRQLRDAGAPDARERSSTPV